MMLEVFSHRIALATFLATALVLVMHQVGAFEKIALLQQKGELDSPVITGLCNGALPDYDKMPAGCTCPTSVAITSGDFIEYEFTCNGVTVFPPAPCCTTSSESSYSSFSDSSLESSESSFDSSTSTMYCCFANGQDSAGNALSLCREKVEGSSCVMRQYPGNENDNTDSYGRVEYIGSDSLCEDSCKKGVCDSCNDDSECPTGPGDLASRCINTYNQDGGSPQIKICVKNDQCTQAGASPVTISSTTVTVTGTATFSGIPTPEGAGYVIFFNVPVTGTVTVNGPGGVPITTTVTGVASVKVPVAATDTATVVTATTTVTATATITGTAPGTIAGTAPTGTATPGTIVGPISIDGTLAAVKCLRSTAPGMASCSPVSIPPPPPPDGGVDAGATDGATAGTTGTVGGANTGGNGGIGGTGGGGSSALSSGASSGNSNASNPSLSSPNSASISIVPPSSASLSLSPPASGELSSISISLSPPSSSMSLSGSNSSIESSESSSFGWFCDTTSWMCIQQ